MKKPLEKAHAELSASGSEKWLNCPASVAVARECPPQPDSKYSLEGTKAHELLELWLEHLVVSTTSFIIPKGYPPAMVEAVKFAVDEIKKDWNQGKNGELQSEQKVSLAHIHPGMFGTLDIRIIEHYGRLIIQDYKHGAGIPVDLQDESATPHFNHNTQLVYYALASAEEFNWDFESVELGIIQPRAPHRLGPKRSVTLSVKQLKGYEEIFRKGVERVFAPNPKRYAGKWCRWCVGKEDCPAFKRMNSSKAATAFSQTLDLEK